MEPTDTVFSNHRGKERESDPQLYGCAMFVYPTVPQHLACITENRHLRHGSAATRELHRDNRLRCFCHFRPRLGSPQAYKTYENAQRSTVASLNERVCGSRVATTAGCSTRSPILSISSTTRILTQTSRPSSKIPARHNSSRSSKIKLPRPTRILVISTKICRSPP